DLQGALDPLGVIGVQLRGARGINGGQLPVQRRPAEQCRLPIDGGAHLGIGGRQGGQTLQQYPKIQHGTPHQQGNAPAGCNVRHQGDGVGGKVGGGIGLGRIPYVDQVMGCPGQKGGVGLGAADVHAPVDQGGVDADDL